MPKSDDKPDVECIHDEVEQSNNLNSFDDETVVGKFSDVNDFDESNRKNENSLADMEMDPSSFSVNADIQDQSLGEICKVLGITEIDDNVEANSGDQINVEMGYSGFEETLDCQQLKMNKPQSTIEETNKNQTDMELEQSQLSPEFEFLLQNGSNSSLKVFFYLPNDFNFLKFCYF